MAAALAAFSSPYMHNPKGQYESFSGRELRQVSNQLAAHRLKPSVSNPGSLSPVANAAERNACSSDSAGNVVLPTAAFKPQATQDSRSPVARVSNSPPPVSSTMPIPVSNLLAPHRSPKPGPTGIYPVLGATASPTIKRREIAVPIVANQAASGSAAVASNALETERMFAPCMRSPTPVEAKASSLSISYGGDVNAIGSARIQIQNAIPMPVLTPPVVPSTSATPTAQAVFTRNEGKSEKNRLSGSPSNSATAAALKGPTVTTSTGPFSDTFRARPVTASLNAPCVDDAAHRFFPPSSTPTVQGVSAPEGFANSLPQLHASPRSTSAAGGSAEIPRLKPLSPSVAGGEGSPSAPKAVMYRCPECRLMVSTLEEALGHCPKRDAATDEGQTVRKTDLLLDPRDDQKAQNVQGEGNDRDVVRSEKRSKGEVIAYDSKGVPSIIRQVDETGQARTIVLKDDGTKQIFGDNTIETLKQSNMKSKKWADTLTDHELRGLVHEVGQRLLEQSRLYHSRLAELEKLGNDGDLLFFGLDENSTAKDLEKAYRKLARRMHPDKNGGTDEAKERFQNMKERYEKLKTIMAEKGNQEENGVKEPSKAVEDDNDASRVGEKKEISDGEKKEKGQDDDTPNEDEKDDDGEGNDLKHDPRDKDSMVETVIKMMRQLKNFDQQMDILVQELERATKSNRL